MSQKSISSKRMQTGSETELDKDHMETKIKKLEDQMGTIARTVEHLEPVSKSKSLWIFNFPWASYYNSKKGPRPNIKIDLVRLEDKETIMANTKKLGDINKNRKPPIIIAPDLTKQQQNERHEKNKGKNPKQKR
uniref:Uncharacterized protein n=1 Tax=Romanomermis culicivorax TaxID=13658 RepID=A0A915J6F7_ROMCU